MYVHTYTGFVYCMYTDDATPTMVTAAIVEFKTNAIVIRVSWQVHTYVCMRNNACIYHISYRTVLF